MHRWRGPTALVSLLFVMACGDLAEGAPRPMTLDDAGISSSADGGPAGGGGRDASGGDTGPPLGPPAMDEVEAGALTADRAAAINACFDGEDPDRDGVVDCAEVVCQDASPACCVGVASAGCCAPPSAVLDLNFGVCVAGGAAGCTGGTTAFGSSAPSVVTSALPGVGQNAIVMNGDGRSDSGLVVTRPIDFTSRRVSVSARIGIPASCVDGCLQTAVIAVTDRSDLVAGRQEHVRPLLGVIVSAPLHQVLLVQGDTVVASTDIVSDVATYTLSLEPNGDAVVTGGVSELRSRWVPSTAGHVVAYGRNVNPSSGTPPPARFEALTVSEGLCDIPNAWSARRQVLPQILPGGGTSWSGAPRIVRAPSAALDEMGSRIVAFETERGVMIAEETRGDGSFSPLNGGTPVLVPGTIDGSFVASRVGDPSIVRTSAGWELFVTVEEAGAGGKTSIAHATAPPGTPSMFTGTRLIETILDGLPVDAELSSPEVVMNGSSWDMFVRYESGEDIRILHLSSADGHTWGNARLTVEDATILAPSHDPLAFDADDVGGTSLVQYGATWELYYTGRRGARTAIGLLVSEDLRSWWNAGRGAPVLTASGSGFDALSVGDPAVLSSGDRVTLLYSGTDGADWRVGRVERDATLHRSL